ncbi:sigma-70 family RNA polymerase sigma factor [Blastopirellula marina]|uniref:RNA polymerase sigma-70 ECF-like HTH domain-containing protein n=1 Tax=Blastopirellula marina DSM 3645 TaxID=314230 RepID=A3ZY98_9BACT|nr:sigma-70 family RNA polymerase sigma factor [Blastopirellula marina]EAQ78574.1 hypothetical protein DSM3645_26864 [Blastopirellula marina DSM 3645]
MAAEDEDTINLKVLQGVRDGSKTSVNVVVDKYFSRIVRAAEKRISAGKQRAADGDDVAASVFESLWKRSDRGDFSDSDFKDADELWGYLSRMARSKVVDHIRRENAAKRGGGKVRGESVFLVRGTDGACGIEAVAPSHFSPDELAEFSEWQGQLLDALQEERLREIATMRLEGYDTEEIGESVGLSTRSIRRKLVLIRDIWKHLLEKQLATQS